MSQIQDKVQALAQGGFGVGTAVTAETPVRDGGTMQQFTAATVIAHPALGTYEVHGLIRDRYEQEGGANHCALGFPLSDEEADPDVPGGRRSRFQFGELTWSAATGVTEVTAGGTSPATPADPGTTPADSGDTPADPGDTPDPAPADATPPAPLQALADVTERVLRELNLVPGGSQRPGPANRAADVAPWLQAHMGDLPDTADKSTWQSLLLACEANGVTLLDTWDPQPLAGIQTIEASATADAHSFALTASTFDYDGTPDALHVVLERPGSVAPKLVAVSFPKSLLEVEQTPFLVYFHPTLGQAVPSGYYTAAPNLKSPEDQHFYPYGWDFLFHGFWKYLNYGGPDFSTQYNMGLVPQVAHGGKDVAVVLPILAADDATSAGDFLQPDRLLQILAEIKWHFTQKADLPDGQPDPGGFRVAVAAFSSGNGLLNSLLANVNSPFCQQALREVYFFDAPAGIGNACVAAALRWAGPDPDRYVRFYSQWSYGDYNQVLGGAQTVQAGHLVVSAAHDTRSVALVPQAFWEPLVPPDVRKDLQARGWAAMHGLVPSALLADALGRSGF